MEKRFYTCEEIAKLMGIKISTARTYCKTGKIPCMKVGKGYRVSVADFNEWLETEKNISPGAEIKKYLTKLKESETRYKNLINQSLDGIVMIDFKGALTLVNPSFCSMVGYSKEELLGTVFSRYIHPDERATAIENHMHRMTGEMDTHPKTKRLLRKDGKTVFTEILAGPVRESGKIVGVQEIIRDVTAQTRLTQELAIILELLPSAVMINDFKGNVYQANSRIVEITGYTKEELMNMKNLVSLYWYPEEREESLALLKEKGEFYNREIAARQKGDVMLPVEMHAKIIEIGGETYIASLVQDITERKQLQNQLRETKEILERTFNALNYGIVHLDTDLKVLFANRWLEVRLPDIRIGKKCHIPSGKKNQPCPWCPALKCLKSGKPEKADATISKPDGTEVKLHISAYPVRDEKGKIIQITELIKDLDQKQDPEWDVMSF